MSARYRLADSTTVEPLVNQFAAWWMTVAPIPGTLNVHAYQVPLLKAFLQAPDFHAKAAKDPALAGTSFVGVEPARADEVKALLQRTVAEQAERIAFAEAFEEFQGWLIAEARGQSLEPLYEKVPAPLRGLVELVYDYFNRPSVRILEALTYRSRYHRPDLHSVRFSRLEADALRPAIYTTPRLAEPGQVEWKRPLSDPRLDRLFALDLEARPLDQIEDGEALLPLLTDAPLPARAPWTGPGPRIRYLGHASTLMEHQGTTILVDPVIGARPQAGGMARLSYAELPERIDYVLITHNHADHLNLESLLRLRHRIGTVVVPRNAGMVLGDYSPRLMLRSLGFANVVDPEALESLPIPDGEIVIAPFLGEHGDLAHAKSSFVVRAGTERVLFAADSTNVDDALYRHLREGIGEIQTVFMNTEIEGAPHHWTLEALFPRKRDRKLEKNRRCRGSNAEEGLRLLGSVGAKRLFNYAMGLEPWVEHIIGPAHTMETPRMKESEKLLAGARERGMRAERLCGPTELRLES